MSRETSALLDSLLRYSRLLDEAVRVPFLGVRIGLDPLLRMIPVVGNTLGFLASLYPLYVGWRLQIPNSILLRMVANLLVDYVVGLVPVAGLFADALWKANKRNCDLVMRSLAFVRDTGGR